MSDPCLPRQVSSRHGVVRSLPFFLRCRRFANLALGGVFAMRSIARRFSPLLLLLLALGAPARAVDLATLVPDDIGMCFEVRDLTTQSKQFFGSELFRRLMEFSPTAKFLEDYVNRPRLIQVALAAKMGVSPDELNRKLMGKRSLLAIWPEQFRSAEDSQLLFLTETDDADPQFARKLIDAFCEALDQPGVLVRADDVAYAGAEYRVRVIRRGDKRLEVCLAAIDDLFVLASGETLMRQALDIRAEQPAAGGSLAQLTPYREAHQRQQADTALSCIIFPQRWLDLVTERMDDDDEEPSYEASAKKVVLDSWRVADYWVFAIRAGERLSFESYLHFDPQRKPEWLEEMAGSTPAESNFLDHVPADAVVAYSGLLDVPEIGHLMLIGAASGDGLKLGNVEEMRQATRGLMMGLDPIDDILPAMGPDVGFFISRTAPLPPPAVAGDAADNHNDQDAADKQNGDDEAGDKPAAKPTWLEMVVGVRTNPRPAGDKRPDVKMALDNGLRTTMVLAAGVENAKRGKNSAKVAVTRAGDIKLTTLSGLEQVPVGMDLTYTFVGDYFLGGLSLGTVRRSATLQQADSLAATPRFRRLFDESIGPPGQLLYIDCLALRSMLAQDPDLLYQTFSPFREMEPQRARDAQKLVIQLLSLTDTLLLTARVEGTGLNISLAFDSPEPEAVSVPVKLQK